MSDVFMDGWMVDGMIYGWVRGWMDEGAVCGWMKQMKRQINERIDESMSEMMKN